MFKWYCQGGKVSRFAYMNQTRSQTLLICFSKVRESEERLGRNDVMVKVAGDARYSFGLPLMQCILIKTFPGATGNKSVSNCNCVELFVRPKKEAKIITC